jgi:hypothetical protein
MQCATHPSVETELACGRCGTPICPRCLVQTPVGARCRDCARVRRVPTYDVPLPFLARAIAAAAVSGVALGAAWRVLFPFSLSIFFGFFVALGLGYAIGESVSLAANRKRGPVLQGVAAGGVVVSYLVRNALFGVLIPANDVFGYVVVAIAIMVAIGRLR